MNCKGSGRKRSWPNEALSRSFDGGSAKSMDTRQVNRCSDRDLKRETAECLAATTVVCRNSLTGRILLMEVERRSYEFCPVQD